MCRSLLLDALVTLGCGGECAPTTQAPPTTAPTARPAPPNLSTPPAGSSPGGRGYVVRPPTDADKARYIEVEEAIARVRKDLRLLSGESGLRTADLTNPAAEVLEATGVEITRATPSDTEGLPGWVMDWVTAAPKREIQPPLVFMRVDAGRHRRDRAHPHPGPSTRQAQRRSLLLRRRAARAPPGD